MTYASSEQRFLSVTALAKDYMEWAINQRSITSSNTFMRDRRPRRTMYARQLVLMKQRQNQKPLMRQLRSEKGQDRTLPASLRMRYKTVAQKTRSSS